MASERLISACLHVQANAALLASTSCLDSPKASIWSCQKVVLVRPYALARDWLSSAQGTPQAHARAIAVRSCIVLAHCFVARAGQVRGLLRPFLQL